MRNPDIKVWMWQRLWKIAGDDEVYSSYGIYEDSWWLHMNPEEVEAEYKWNWLCPKPNLVLT